MARIEGVIVREGQPVEGAYVRLLGPSGEFVGERRTSKSGTFRYNVGLGKWTLRWMLAGQEGGEQVLQITKDEVLKPEIKVD